MDSLPEEESGQDLDEMAKAGETSENSKLVNPTSNAKTNILNVFNNAGCVIFIVYLVYLCFYNGITLFSFHPTLMSIGWLLLMISAINSLSPGDMATEWMPVRSRTTRHWVLQACGLAILTAGFLVIVINKIINNKYHFQTLHSCFGLAAYILALVASCGGLSTLYSLKFKKFIAPVNIKIIHATAGLFTFVIGMITIILGLFSGWWAWNSGIRIACVILLILITLLTILRPSIKTFVRIRERLTFIRSSN